jgi:hypothetical protein
MYPVILLFSIPLLFGMPPRLATIPFLFSLQARKLA